MVGLEETWVGEDITAPVDAGRPRRPVLLVGGDRARRRRVVDLLIEVLGPRPLVRSRPEPRAELIRSLGDLVASATSTAGQRVVVVLEEAHHLEADDAAALVLWSGRHQVDLLLSSGRAAGGRFLGAGCLIVDLAAARIELGQRLLRRIHRTPAPAVVETLLDHVADDPEALVALAGRLDDGHLAGWIELPVPLPVGAAVPERGANELPDGPRCVLGLVALARVPTDAVIRDAAQAVGLDPVTLGRAEGQGSLRRTDQLRWVVDPTLRAGFADALTGAERRAMHAALGHATQRHVPSATLAALRHLVAGGVQPVSVLVEQLRVTAEQARRRGAFEVAIRAEAEAALLRPPGTGRDQLLLRAAELAWEIGRGEWSRDLLAAARESEDSTDAGAGLVTLETKLAASRPGGIDLHGSLVEAAEVARIDPEAASERCLVITMVGIMRGQLRHAGAAATQARWYAGEDHLRRALAMAWQAGIDALTTSQARPTLRLSEAEDAIVASLAAPGRPVALTEPVVAARCWLLLNRLAFDELDAVRLGARELVGGLSASGRLGLLALPLGTLALAEYRRGWWDAANEHGTRATELATTSGQPTLAANGDLARAWVSAARGEAGVVADLLRPVRVAAEVEGAELLLGFLRAVEGLLELSTGAPERALVHLEQAHGFARAQGIVEPRFLACAGDLLDAYLAVGDRSAAIALLDELRDANGEHGWVAGVVARGDALLRDDGRSMDRYARSCAAFEAIPMPFEEARSRLAWAIAAERVREFGVAHRQADHATVLFGGLRAHPWTARASAVAARAKRSVTAGGRWETLTVQERRIARLVAAGRSNREVAEVCHVSPKTVEYHLHHIYQKLGLGNRTQLAALAAALVERDV